MQYQIGYRNHTLVKKLVYGQKKKEGSYLLPSPQVSLPLSLGVVHVAGLDAVQVAAATDNLAALADDVGALAANVSSLQSESGIEHDSLLWLSGIGVSVPSETALCCPAGTIVSRLTQTIPTILKKFFLDISVTLCYFNAPAYQLVKKLSDSYHAYQRLFLDVYNSSVCLKTLMIILYSRQIIFRN